MTPTLERIKVALKDGRTEECFPLTDDIVDILIELSFDEDEQVTQQCYEILSTLEKDFLESEREKRRDEAIEALSSRNFDKIKGNESEYIGLLLEAAVCEQVDVKRRARLLLSELEMPEAREALCAAAMDNPTAAQITVDACIEPAAPADRLAFYAFTEQWEKLDEADLENAQLIRIFINGDTRLKERLASAIASRKPIRAVEMLAAFAAGCFADYGCFAVFKEAFTDFDSILAIDHFCALWEKDKSAPLQRFIMELGWTATRPLHLKVQTALLTGNVDVLDMKSIGIVHQVIDALRSGVPGMQQPALDALEKITAQVIVDQVCKVWFETNDARLEELIIRKQWTASYPDEVKISTLLLCGKLDQFDREKTEDALAAFDLMQKKGKIELVRKGYLCSINRQDMVDALWKRWKLDPNPNLKAFLLKHKKVAASPADLSVYSQLLIEPEALRACGCEQLKCLLEYSKDSESDVFQAARTTLEKLENAEAIDELCRAALDGDREAGNLVVACGYAPSDPLTRASFFLQLGAWSKYKELDPDRVLFSQVYDGLEPFARIDFLRKLRGAAQDDLIAGLIADEQPLQLASRSVEEWEMLLPALKLSERWQDIWICAQNAVPIVSLKLFRLLRVIGWEPPGVDDQDFLNTLGVIMRNCNEDGPEPVFSSQVKTLPDKSVVSLALSADGRTAVAALAERRIRIRPISGAKPGLIYAEWLGSSADGGLIAGRSENGRLNIFRTSDGAVLKELPDMNVCRALILPESDKVFLATGGCALDVVANDKKSRSVLGRSDMSFQDMVLSRDGKYIALSSHSNVVIVVDARSEKMLFKIHSTSIKTITSIAFSEDHLVLGGEPGLVEVWRFRQRNVEVDAVVVCSKAYSAVPSAMAAFAKDGVVIGFSDGSVVRGKAADLGGCRVIAQLDRAITNLACDAGGLSIALTEGTTLKVLEETLGRLAVMPIGLISEGDIISLDELRTSKKLSIGDQSWCEFISRLCARFGRYDVEVVDSPSGSEQGLTDIEVE